MERYEVIPEFQFELRKNVNAKNDCESRIPSNFEFFLPLSRVEAALARSDTCRKSAFRTDQSQSLALIRNYNFFDSPLEGFWKHE